MPDLAQATLLATARRVIPGGSLGLFRLPPEVDMVVAEGRAGHVIDLEGKDYVDFHLGSGPAFVGHGHPRVVDAVQRQIVRGSTYYFLNQPVIELAERMVDAIPCAEQILFTGSGSEATLYALRFARATTGREDVLKFEGAWHGMNDYALWGTTPQHPSDYPRASPDSTGVPGFIGPHVLVSPFNDIDAAVATIERHAATLAAVIVEPLQRVLLPRPGFLQAVRAATAKHGIMLVFDEVVTGFRIAWGGAQERYGVIPDLATYGKAMSGGLPMAALAGPRAVLERSTSFSPQHDRVWAGGTLNGNPIAAAAGVASLEALSEPGIYDRVRQMGERLRRGIREQGAAHGLDVQALGEDVVFGVRFMANPAPQNWTDLLTADRELGLRWSLELIRRGVLVNPNEKLYLSIAHTDDDIDRALEASEAAFAAVTA